MSATVWLGSALLTLAARRLALSRGIVDVPNARSSHVTPTPRGGGIAIVLVSTAAFLALGWRGLLGGQLLLALVVGGVAVAAVGFADDHRPLRSSIRLAVHLGAAIWAVACLGGLPPLRVGAHVLQLGWAGQVIAVLAIVWTLNLFNFMDGIDGIAGSEAVFVTLAAAWLTAAGPEAAGLRAVDLVLAAATAGFLLWNWPPAKIFLGDVGSGYLGYMIAVLALAAGHDNPVAIWVWLILGGAFFADATATLARRVLRRERVYEAHRSHAYQWLARRWGSHRKVTVALLVVNLAWLLPWAMLAAKLPRHALAIVFAALAPLAVLALASGAGRAEVGGTERFDRA
jgi:Fuc2NAc and GlcNAc transferase